jgi:hypothetical protein
MLASQKKWLQTFLRTTEGASCCSRVYWLELKCGSSPRGSIDMLSQIGRNNHSELTIGYSGTIIVLRVANGLAIAILISFYTWSGQRLARRARTMTAIHGVALYNLAQPGSSLDGMEECGQLEGR